jgi:hypothetical protein
LKNSKYSKSAVAKNAAKGSSSNAKKKTVAPASKKVPQASKKVLVEDVTLFSNKKHSLQVRVEKAPAYVRSVKKKVPGKYDHVVLHEEDIFGLGAYGKTFVKGIEQKESFVDFDSSAVPSEALSSAVVSKTVEQVFVENVDSAIQVDSVDSELLEEYEVVGPVEVDYYPYEPSEDDRTLAEIVDTRVEDGITIEKHVEWSDDGVFVTEYVVTDDGLTPIVESKEVEAENEGAPKFGPQKNLPPVPFVEEVGDEAFGFFDDAPVVQIEAPIFDNQKKKKFTFDESEEEKKPLVPKSKKKSRQIIAATEEESAKAKADAEKTARGIALKKKAARQARHAEVVKESEKKKTNISNSRKLKQVYVSGWMDDYDSMPTFSGDVVPKDKHQKKTRARKESNVVEAPRKYTAEAVRAFRKDKAAERQLKKDKKNARLITESKNVISDVLDSQFNPAVVGFIEWIINFVDVIRTICRQKDEDVRRCILSQWVQAQGFRLIESTVISTFITKIIATAPVVEEFKESKRGFTTQALSDQLDHVGDILEYTFDSSFADSIKNFLISCASMKFFNKQVDERIFFYLGAPMRLPVYDLTRIAIKSLAKVVKALEDINNGMEISQALFMKDPWVFNRAKFTQLMFQQNHLYTGLPVEGKYPKSIWLKEANDVLKYFKERQKVTSSLKPQYLELSTMITQLEEARCNVVVTMAGGYRNAPFAVCIGRLPGIGKSNLIDFLVYEWCRVKGYNFSADMIFHRDMTSDFWDGLSSQIAYHYSEVGTASKKIAESKGDPIAMELTSIIDSVMKSVNMADLKDKGKIKAMPEIVVADTNNFSMNFDVMTINFAAFMRRFLFIEATVKPKYRREGTCQIDFSKCNDGSHFLDRWTFKAWREYAIDTVSTKPVVLLENGDIFQLSKILRSEYANHIASQTFVENLRADNKLFRLDPEEKDFPSNDPVVAIDAPAGKKLVDSFLDNASSYAEYSKQKWTELRDRVFGHSDPLVDTELKEFNSDMRGPMDEFDLDLFDNALEKMMRKRTLFHKVLASSLKVIIWWLLMRLNSVTLS